MNIEERLDRLEKQNLNLRRGLVGLLLLVLVVPLAAFVWQDKKPKVAKFDTIEARTLRAARVFVREREGSRATITLGTEGHAAILGLVSEGDCKTAAMLMVKAPTKEDPAAISSLVLHGEKNGYVRIQVNDGAQQSLSLLDGSEKRRVLLYHKDKLKVGGLRVGTDDRTRAFIGLHERVGPRLHLFDAAGHTRAILGSTIKQDPRTGRKSTLPESTFTLFDDKERIIHQAPK